MTPDQLMPSDAHPLAPAPPPGPLRRFAAAARVAWRITRLNFRARLEYRGEFVLSVCVGIVWQTSIVVFAVVLLNRFSGMGGWGSRDILLITAVRMLAHGICTLLWGNSAWLSQWVQEGRVEGWLLRPMPVFRQAQLSQFPVNALGDLAVGVALFVAALERSGLHWTPERAFFLAAAVVGGALTEGAIFTALTAPVLHFPAADYWSSWAVELMGTFGNYPLSILPSGIAALLTYVFPLAFIAYVPVGVVTGHGHHLGTPLWLAVAAPLVGLGLFIGARLLWNASLRRYTGMNG